MVRIRLWTYKKNKKLKEMSFWLHIKAFEYEALDRYISSLTSRVVNEGYIVKGPINLPNKIRKITLLKSPHVNKQSREQFEIRSHSRLLGISSKEETCLGNFVEELRKTFPVGFSLKITRKL